MKSPPVACVDLLHIPALFFNQEIRKSGISLKNAHFPEYLSSRLTCAGNKSPVPATGEQPATTAPAPPDPEPSRPAAVETLTPRERRFAVALCVFGILLYFLVNIHRVAIPGQIFSQLQAELGASASAIAGLSTAFMYVYAATQLIVGVLVDRYGGMRVLALGGVVMSLGSLLFACSTSLWMLFASRALVGLGGGCAYLSLVKECARLYPLRFTTVLGFVILFGYSGGVAGTYPFVGAVNAWGWRSGMLGIAFAGVLVMAGMALFWRRVRKPPVNHAAALSFEPYRRGFSNIHNLKGIFSYSLSFGLYYVVLTVVGKKFLEDAGGIPPAVAALCCSVMVLLSALCNQATGILSALNSNRRRPFILLQTAVVPAGSLLVLAGMLLVSPGPVRGLLLIAGFLLITFASGFSPVTNAIMLEVNPPSLTGVGVGIGNFSAYAFVALVGTLSGGVLDCFRGQAQADASGALRYPDAAYVVLFLIYLLIGLGAHAMARRLSETGGRNIHVGAARTVRVLGLRLTLRY